MLSHAAFTAYAASLQGLDLAPQTNVEGQHGQLLAQNRLDATPPASRLPAP